MNRVIQTFAILAVMTSFSAYLTPEGDKPLYFRDNSLQPYDQQLSNAIYTVNYLPSDIPGNYVRNEYNTFTADQPTRPLYESCTKQCSTTNNPVCGQDNQTYFNLCHALCNSTKLRSLGACVNTGFAFGDCGKCANSLTDPVCGSDGLNYPNQCFARCSGLSTFTGGCCCGTPGCCFGAINTFLYRTK